MKYRVEWLVAALLLVQYTPAQTSKLLRQEAKLLPYRLAEAKKRGFPMTGKEADGPEISDGENAAAILCHAEESVRGTFKFLDLKESMPSRENDTILKVEAPYFEKTYLAASKHRFRPSSKVNQFPAVKNAVKRLCFRAEIRARIGDVTGALSDIRTASSIAEFPLQQSNLISALVVVADSAILVSRLERIAAFWEHYPDRLAELEAIVVKSYHPIDAREITRQESFMIRHLGFHSFKRNPKRQDQEVYLDAFESARLAIDIDLFDAAAKDPFRPWKLKPKSLAFKMNVERDPLLREAAEGFLEPIQNGAAEALLKRVAYQNCLISLLHCLKYRAIHGHLAPTLHDMKADLEDPCSEKPLRFLQTPDGFRVYSIGINREDDHGVSGLDMGNPVRGDFALGSPPLMSRPRKKS